MMTRGGDDFGTDEEQLLLPACCPWQAPWTRWPVLRVGCSPRCRPPHSRCTGWRSRERDLQFELKRARWMYVTIVVFAVALMGSMSVPSLQSRLHEMFRDLDAACKDLRMGNNCMKLTGYMAVFKIALALSAFFSVMALITVNLPLQRGGRTYINNHMWTSKWILLLVLILGTFVIPISHLDHLHSSWIYTCHLGNGVFIVLQAVILVRCTNRICQTIHRLARQGRPWRVLELLASLSVISVWMVMAIALFLIHGQRQYCLTKQFILITNTALCGSLVLASITPCARGSGRSHLFAGRNSESEQSSLYANRLIQSGLVAIYVTFWVWSAMQSSPEQPGAVETSFLMDKDDLACRNHQPNRIVENSLTGTATILALFTLVYVSSSWTVSHGDGEAPKDPVDQFSRRTHQVCLFHGFHVLVLMHVTTQLTKWFHPDGYARPDFEKSWTIVGLKVAGGWISAALYLLYQLLPRQCFPATSQGHDEQPPHEEPGIEPDLCRNNSRSPSLDTTARAGCQSFELTVSGTRGEPAALPVHSISRMNPAHDLRQNLGHI